MNSTNKKFLNKKKKGLLHSHKILINQTVQKIMSFQIEAIQPLL